MGFPPDDRNDAGRQMPGPDRGSSGIESWTDQNVNESGEHFEIWYEGQGMRTKVLVARLSPPVGKVLGIQFLLDHENPPVSEAKREAIREIEFYMKTAKPEFWGYMKYHAGTSSNIYSSVHWVLKEAKP